MTPAQKMGLKVGDKVRVIGLGLSIYPIARANGVNTGSVITFIADDGTDIPKFESESGFRWYESLSNVIPIFIPSTVTGPATITVAAGETITFEGNATVKQDWVPKFGDRVVFVEPPEDMVGEFGVVTDVEYPDEYGVTYNDGSGSDRVWLATDKIKPYEAN